jgi:UDP-N-acetylglucosamine 1-carboxyvinyltransferase
LLHLAESLPYKKQEKNILMKHKKIIVVKKSENLQGEIKLFGAKNAVLVIIASLILTKGVSTLYNVPNNFDVQSMIFLIESLGAHAVFDVNEKILTVDTRCLHSYKINPKIMKKMRASILVMGPLLARFGKVVVALAGGCSIGARPINYHLDGFAKMDVDIVHDGAFIYGTVRRKKRSFARKIRLDYPSVGTTENLLLFASSRNTETFIENASFEPEVIDLASVLKKMGASIKISDRTIMVKGRENLCPISHSIVPDRLEAGSFLLAVCATGGSLLLPNARASHLRVVLDTLKNMGNKIREGIHAEKNVPDKGVLLEAVGFHNNKAVAIKTAPYPGFPTDLQAPFAAVLCAVKGTSIIEETVFENRFKHFKELKKMGASVIIKKRVAYVDGVKSLDGCCVKASDIRTSAALVIAGLYAEGKTCIEGVEHLLRGYDSFDEKLRVLGANISIQSLSSAVESSETSLVIRD